MNFHIWDRTEEEICFHPPTAAGALGSVRRRAEPFIRKPGISVGAGAAGQRSGQVLTFDLHVGGVQDDEAPAAPDQTAGLTRAVHLGVPPPTISAWPLGATLCGSVRPPCQNPAGPTWNRPLVLVERSSSS